GAQAQAVAHDHVAQVFDPAFHLLEPDRSAGQSIGRADVKHQEAVDEAEAGRGVDVGREQIGVARLRAPVAAHVQVPALLGRDDAEVFALRFGTLAHTTADRALQFVWCTDALVTLLDLDREADRILDAVAAPRAADAALHRADRFAVGVPALEA